MSRTVLRFGAPLACASTLGLLFAGVACAADKPSIDTGDTAWLVQC
jgi:ammonium transporter, Amt family